MSAKRRYNQSLWDLSSPCPRRTQSREKKTRLEISNLNNVQHTNETDAGNEVSERITSSEEPDLLICCNEQRQFPADSDDSDRTVPDGCCEGGPSRSSEAYNSDREDCDATTTHDRDDTAYDSHDTDDSADESLYEEEPAQEEPMDDLDQPLYSGSKLTRRESLLLILAHSLRHHSSKEATESLLRLVDAHIPDTSTLPLSKYIFYNQFATCTRNHTFHMYCLTCHSYLLQVGDNDTTTPATVLCTQCDCSHNIEKLMKSGSYFVMLNIESQVRDLLEQHGLPTRRKDAGFDMSDITDSVAYRKLPMEEDDVSITWNTDGVPVFESSGFSIWPLQLIVNNAVQIQK
ncbi:uncharacterized protein LOC135386419 [Ornithodoros turicata]|uniref:uncharacterized protein LOC135386419 n=1 Tax=Ornithodoros turicata TaxID=34597 RepID=UPI003138A727